jgi:hypothetical protein
MGLKEAYLHDYLAVSLIGVVFGLIGLQSAVGLAAGGWGPYIAGLLLYGLFLVAPGGFVASYLHMKLHGSGENLEMQGLSIGFFTGVVYTIITVFMTIAAAIANTANAGNLFIGWILSVLFAFIFFMLGGYASGVLERRPFAMPSFFNLSQIRRQPPPPPGPPAQTCPTCGRPMTFIQQYNRWYCPNCKKYA